MSTRLSAVLMNGRQVPSARRLVLRKMSTKPLTTGSYQHFVTGQSLRSSRSRTGRQSLDVNFWRMHGKSACLSIMMAVYTNCDTVTVYIYRKTAGLAIRSTSEATGEEVTESRSTFNTEDFAANEASRQV